MNALEIKKHLSGNKWNKFAFNAIVNYIIDVQDTLSKFISQQDVINRFTLDDRLKNGIKFVNHEKITLEGCDAMYDYEKK
ncbi:MAG: hypothetical protein IJR82_04740 [Bacilli bacterium]|nr:hypothetical protein [Bacilli bacterium]